MSLKSMDNTTEWAENGGGIGNFYDIFKIPLRNKIEIDYAINDFSNAFTSYGKFCLTLEKEVQMKKRFEPLILFSEDVLGNTATSIKLAGEGYISESLAILRSAIDILISSLFASLALLPEEESDIHAFAEALSSEYYHRLKEISLDDLVINHLYYKDKEEREKSINDEINQVANQCLDYYIEKMNINKESADWKQTKYHNFVKQALNEITIDAIKNSGNWKDLIQEVVNPKELLFTLMGDDRFTFRACKDHEDKLLDKLKKNLGLSTEGEMTEEMKNELRKLTFKTPEDYVQKHPEGNIIICDDCEKPPTIWGVHVRFDKNSMLKYIRYFLDKATMDSINNCVRQNLEIEEKISFPDFINYKIYSELNPYSHGNPKEDPTIKRWYNSFMKPFLIVLSCIYENVLLKDGTPPIELEH
ncbi:MAG: hypothetical protein QXQ46_09135 [Thermoplasmatales archaeon]